MARRLASDCVQIALFSNDVMQNSALHAGIGLRTKNLNAVCLLHDLFVTHVVYREILLTKLLLSQKIQFNIKGKGSCNCCPKQKDF